MRRPRSLVMASVLLTLAGVLTAGQVSCQHSEKCYCNSYNQKTIEKIVGSNAVIFYDGLPLGSGVTYRKNGKLYVLTASHVLEDETQIKNKCPWFSHPNFVEIQNSLEECDDEKQKEKSWGTKEIKVVLFSGEFESAVSTEKGKLVFNDPKYDLAIIEVNQEIPTTELVTGSLFDYSTPKLGVPVYIMGNPSNDYMSITQGIIGNNNRSRGSLSEHVPFFYQTDADGAPGSSGGGLYRADSGKCIGVVVMLNCRNWQVYSVPILFLKETLIRNNHEELLPPEA